MTSLHPSPHPPFTVLAAATLLLGGCVSYEPEPLDPAAILAAVEADRRAPRAADDGVDLDQAFTWLRDRGPEIQAAFAAWRTAHRRAGVATPWQNPTVMVGVQYGSGPEVDGDEFTPMAQLTLRIPVSDRLEAADALDRARAEHLRLEALLTVRELERATVGDLAHLVLARARADELTRLADSSQRAAEVMARSVRAAGRGSALDVAVLELDAARARNEAVAAARAVDRVQHRLARRLGVAADRLEQLAPSLGDWLPRREDLDDDSLRQHLLDHHPELVRLRAEHEVTERQLRLEIERQYPDLQLTPQFNAEPGGALDVIGLGIGWQLPLFDRNQKGIATALARREEVRIRHEAATRTALAELDAARRAVARETDRLRGLHERVLPLADDHAALARRAAAAGEIDALRILEIERAVRRLRAESLEAERDALEAWRQLEEAVGTPLLGIAPATETLREAAASEEDSDDTALLRAAVGPWGDQQDDETRSRDTGSNR